MDFSKFLVVVWFVCFQAICKSCCDDYTCPDWKTQTDCENYSECLWKENACSLPTSCTGLAQTDCYGKVNGTCRWVNEACKVPSCGDYTTAATCDLMHVGNGYCKYTNGACAPTTSCSDWSDDALSCIFVTFDSKPCTFDNGACKSSPAVANPVCADHNNSETICVMLGCKYSNSDGKCTAYASCSEMTDEPTCVLGSLSHIESKLDCVWNSTDKKCINRPLCSSYTSQADCASYCYYLDTCPVKDDSASAISFSVTLIVLLLAFLL